MRKYLKEIGTEKRHTFTATFERFGKKSAFKGPALTTLLFLNIKDEEGNILTDHLWFNLTKGFEACDLKCGDIVEFDGRVEEYVKGYFGYKEDVYVPISSDWKISRPTNIKVIKRAEVEA